MPDALIRLNASIAAEFPGLVVGLGKPRQETWILRYAARTRARVLPCSP